MTRIILKNSNVLEKRPALGDLVGGELAVNTNPLSPGLFTKVGSGSGQSLVKLGPVAVSATAPNTNPAGTPGNSYGELWFNTNTKVLNVYDGTAWQSTAGPPALARTTTKLTTLGVDAGALLLDNAAATLIGNKAGSKLANGNSNAVVVGNNALETATNSLDSVIVGGQAANKAVGATSSVIIGYQAASETTGVPTQIVAIGASALNLANENTSQSIAIGYQSLKSSTSGVNTAIGFNSLQNLTTGTYNTAMGFQAGIDLTTGSGNTLLGWNTNAIGTASNNILIGSRAFPVSSSGNVIIGNNDSLTTLPTLTGGNNVLVGNQITNWNAASSGTVVIGNNFNATNTQYTNYVIICDGAGNRRLTFNANGALQLNNDFGAYGNVLKSRGESQSPYWSAYANPVSGQDSFQSADGKTITIQDGIITSIT